MFFAVSHEAFYWMLGIVLADATLRLCLRYIPNMWNLSKRSVGYARRDWRSLPDFPSQSDAVLHAVIVPVYSESKAVVDASLANLAKTTAASTQMCVVIAVEAHSKHHVERAAHWSDKWGSSFLHFAVTSHVLQKAGPENPGKGMS